MFDLIVSLSRYYFIAAIGLFLYAGSVYVFDERRYNKKRLSRYINWQRIIIVLMHIVAFLLIAFNGGSFRIEIFILGIVAMLYYVVSFVAVDKIYKQSCPVIWNCMFFLTDISLIMLARLNFPLAQKQMLFMALGTVLSLMIPFIFRMLPKFEKLEPLYLVLAILFVVLPFFIGNKEYGALNWISIFGFGFQPSEIVKFLFIFYIASVFRRVVELKELIVTAVVAGIIVLVLVYQRDLGGALIFSTTYLLMLYIATSNYYLLFGGLSLAVAASFIAYKFFSHVRVRVMAWKNPWADIDYGGYQITQSLFAITTWGFLGSGLTKGISKSIPVVEKDFIFAAVCEEFGGLFALMLIGVYVLMFLRGFLVAVHAERRYYSLLAAGIVIMLSFQAFLILGGVTKFIPLTGVTLPFLSYGGSSVLVSILMAGILQWINIYCERHKAYDSYKGGRF